jgi:hypothetical protein
LPKSWFSIPMNLLRLIQNVLSVKLRLRAVNVVTIIHPDEVKGLCSVSMSSAAT